MKKIAFLAICLCSYIIASANSNNDTLAVYKAVIKRLKSQPEADRFSVSSSTTKSSSFINLEFFVDLDNKGTVIRAKEGWKTFVRQIDTKKMKDFELATNGKPWFGRMKPTGIHLRKFSPIIFNSDNTLALVNVTLISEYKTSEYSEHDMSEAIYYLEKDDNGKWKVIHVFTHLMT